MNQNPMMGNNAMNPMMGNNVMNQNPMMGNNVMNQNPMMGNNAMNPMMGNINQTGRGNTLNKTINLSEKPSKIQIRNLAKLFTK
jgi:hypothetical protein